MAIIKKHYLTDGEFIVTAVPLEIHTVLGSCVSVCLWDQESKIAGMNHYLIPGPVAPKVINPNHGHASTRMLIRSMVNRGCLLKNMEAKVFGGSSLLTPKDAHPSIGAKNVEAAYFILKGSGIQITSYHTGGNFGRKIIFHTLTGKIKMFLLNRKQQ